MTERREQSPSWASHKVVGSGPRPTPGGDQTIAALDALSGALEEVAREQVVLSEKVARLRQARAEGAPWLEILNDEEGQSSIQLVSRLLACISVASGVLRKELVEELRREGVSIPTIAKLFGVSHQRVSNLLRRDS